MKFLSGRSGRTTAERASLLVNTFRLRDIGNVAGITYELGTAGEKGVLYFMLVVAHRQATNRTVAQVIAFRLLKQFFVIHFRHYCLHHIKRAAGLLLCRSG